MQLPPIPCSVEVLTRNSAHTLERCLNSLIAFAEVLVIDGGSTDGTRILASRYTNVRILDQATDFLDADGRIQDFAAVRNDGLAHATEKWIFLMDSDECLSPEAVNEVRYIIECDEPAVYDAFRRFYVNDKKILQCAGYPALQIRLFHRSLTDGFTKAVHERLILKQGVVKKMLTNEVITPLPPARQLEEKYQRYLALEVSRLGVLSWRRWIRWILWRNIRTFLGLGLIVLWIRLHPARGAMMPLAYEWQYMRHAVLKIFATFPPRVVHLQRLQHEA